MPANISQAKKVAAPWQAKGYEVEIDSKTVTVWPKDPHDHEGVRKASDAIRKELGAGSSVSGAGGQWIIYYRDAPKDKGDYGDPSSRWHYEGVMSEASRLVESVLQGGSPRGVITRALDEAIQTVAELQSAVEAAIRRSFPHGQLQLRFSNSFGSPAISGRFTIAANSHELVNGIEHNDLGHTIFFIYGLDKDGNIPGPLTFDPSLGGKVIVNPGPGSYMAYDSVRVGLSKKTGTPEQIVKHIEGYFAKLLATLRSNRERLPQDHVALLKSIHL